MNLTYSFVVKTFTNMVYFTNCVDTSIYDFELTVLILFKIFSLYLVN